MSPEETTPRVEETNNLSFKFPGGIQSMIWGPAGLKDAVETLIRVIKEQTGVKVTRNALILAAIRHYCQFLASRASLKDALASIESTVPATKEAGP